MPEFLCSKSLSDQLSMGFLRQTCMSLQLITPKAFHLIILCVINSSINRILMVLMKFVYLLYSPADAKPSTFPFWHIIGETQVCVFGLVTVGSCVRAGTGYAGRRKHRSHKFLCLRVGRPMKKTFISNASASMQQYAQQGKKHEYWFAVPQERSVCQRVKVS